MQAGVRVDGIELSQDMVDRMREKPGGDQVDVTMGDMSRVTTGRTYGLTYLVFNTIGNLLRLSQACRLRRPAVPWRGISSGPSSCSR
ncbi:hypothetical protein ACFXO2_42545 [Streptomyces sp. NPDC059152]|uniref:hypothetical protein n=1 Tax=Streptomyces sp. NPDC059152 TaxID=3346742 RepID=UPI0036D0ED6A